MAKRLIFLLLCCCCGIMSAEAQVYDHLYPVFRTHPDGFRTVYQYGYVNDSGKVAIDYVYDQGDFFINGHTRAMKDRKWGLIDTTGQFVLPPIYTEMMTWRTEPYWTGTIYPDSIMVFAQGGKLICQGYGEMALNDSALNRIIFNNTRGPHGMSATLFDYTGNKIKDLKAPAGQVVQLSYIDQDGVWRKNKKALHMSRGQLPAAITDMQGNIMIDSVDGVGFYHGYMVLNGPNKAGVIDTNLHQIIPFSAGYTAIQRMEHTPYFNVMKGGKWGIIDGNLHEIFPLQFNDRIWQNNAQQFTVYDKDTRFYSSYTYNGTKLYESKDAVQLYFAPNSYPVPMRRNDTIYQLWKDRYISKPHEFISYFNNEGFAYTYDKGVKSIIDTTGNVLFTTTLPFLSLPDHGIMGAGYKIPCPACGAYRCALIHSSEQESYAQVHFYIDMQGKKLFKDTFERINPFRYGQAEVTKGCYRYLINARGEKLTAKTGNIVMTGYAAGARIVADKNKQQALMDTNGKIISPWVATFRQKEGVPVSYHFFETNRAEYTGGTNEMLPDFDHGHIIFEKEGRYGMMDSTGKTLVEPIYKGMGIEYGPYYHVFTTDDKEGVLRIDGTPLIPAIYSKISYYYEPKVFLLYKNDNDLPEVFIDRN